MIGSKSENSAIYTAIVVAIQPLLFGCLALTRPKANFDVDGRRFFRFSLLVGPTSVSTTSVPTTHKQMRCTSACVLGIICAVPASGFGHLPKPPPFIEKFAFTASLSTMVALGVPSSPALAVSGGGLDYANLDITGDKTSYAGKSFKGKDFTQTIAKETSFKGSNLQGTRFFKAYLVNADFTGADLRGASLEDTSLDGASLKQADVRGAYFSRSLEDVGSIEGADFSDASLPPKLLPVICMRDDATGTNVATGVSTRESLMCD